MIRRSAAAAGAALALILCGPVAAAPVLRAHSRSIDVRDGEVFLKGIWLSDPASDIDVYEARRSGIDKRVTFISDLDSLAFDVTPGQTYDFLIVLDDRDTCATRLSTRTLPYARSGAGPDTIPIAIEHGKLHLRGAVNGSKPLDLLFDTGADIHVLYPSARRKGARLEFDGTSTNVGTGGATERRTSSANRIEVAGLRWDHELVLAIERQADRADGILGYTAFSDRVVQFDHGRGVMIVHDSLPPIAREFVRVPLTLVGSLTAVEASFGPGGARGPFILDTGGTGTLGVNAAFGAAHGLPGDLKTLGRSRSRGVGAATVQNVDVLLPELTIAGFPLRDVPLHVEQSAATGEAPVGKLYMDVLERFDLILDYPGGAAYVRPNARFDEPFRRRGGPPPAVFAGLVVVLVALGLVVLKRRWRPPLRAVREP